MFQGTRANKDDTLMLVRTINRVVSDDPITDENLGVIFEAMWPKLELRLQSLPGPSEAIPARRPPDEVMNEILELVRAQASHREKTKFMDAYIPTFQQFLPLLQQLIANANRQVLPNKPVLRHPRDTSIERTDSQNKILNTFRFPRTLQTAMPIDPRHSNRCLDLVQMSGSTASTPEGAYGQVNFTVKGISLSTDTEETYDIGFTLEIATARKIALYLDQIAVMSDNIQQLQNAGQALDDAKKDPHPER